MSWSECKARGNRLYQTKSYKDAVEAYGEALEQCAKGEDRAILFKNRAAAYLKMKDFKLALADCDAALEISPRDIKSLYRRCQALEGIGQLSEAFKTIKTVLAIDPGNKEAMSSASRLVEAIRQQADIQQSTSERVKDMFATLASGTDANLMVRAAKNFAILSRESSGRRELLANNGLVKLVKLLDSRSDEIVHHILQTFIGLCVSPDVTMSVVNAVSLDKLATAVKQAGREVSTSAIALLRTAMVTMSDKSSETNDDLLVSIVHTMLAFMLSTDVTASSRDAVLEAITTTLQKEHLIKLYVQEGLLDKLLHLSTSCHASSSDVPISQDVPVSQDVPISPGVPVTDDCHMNLCVMLSKLGEYFNKDKKLTENVQSECRAFILKLLRSREVARIAGGLSALSVVLQSTLEIGNDIFNEDIVIEKAIEMANYDEPHCQEMAAEVLSLAASNKSRCDGILQKCLPTLKQLYSSSSDRVRVRALVGLCRLGSVGGSNINARTFAEGSTVKLGKMCRKFLVGSKKGRRLCKWAVEGLAFLSLDAEVKEALVADTAALEVLYSCAKSVDHSQLYGVATILVNLTNSYDKAERNPELEELGKYAGENIPKEHELDGEEYVKKRVSLLMQGGVIPCVILLASLKSPGICEQSSRVFLAICGEPKHRGAVIQQGGVKTLLSIATATNTDKGKLIAAQALAKIGITNDPRLAFPGQRSLEVIRPLVQLLKADHGLQQFEGLMALTNLAGLSEDVRLRIYHEGAVPLMESLMFEEHELIRRASTEALCNMLSLEQVHERFHSDDIERVKLWILFSGEEDEKLALAASGGVAQLTHDPKLCEKVMEVKSAFEILKELLGNVNPDLQYRGVYILTNLVMANAGIARKIVESDFLEVFMALAQTPSTSERVKVCVSKALSKCVEYGLIKPNT